MSRSADYKERTSILKPIRGKIQVKQSKKMEKIEMENSQLSEQKSSHLLSSSHSKKQKQMDMRWNCQRPRKQRPNLDNLGLESVNWGGSLPEKPTQENPKEIMIWVLQREGYQRRRIWLEILRTQSQQLPTLLERERERDGGTGQAVGGSNFWTGDGRRWSVKGRRSGKKKVINLKGSDLATSSRGHRPLAGNSVGPIRSMSSEIFNKV